MVWRRVRFCSILALAALGLLSAGSRRAEAQVGAGAAGVEVDADGVLRTKIIRDETGALTRQRLAEAKAKLDPELMRPSKLRKVSLNRLEAAVEARFAKGEFETDDMKYLAGLTSIQYVFFYPETNDIVIAGPAEGFIEDISGRAVGIMSGRAVLELQDLIVALRAFPPSGKQTKLIGVSIDPTQEGLKKMRDFLVAISGRVSPNDAERIAAGLKENLGLQTVRIDGISPQTHFAQVLVEADYRMKLIGIGLEAPAVNIPSYVAKANARDVSRNALQRWFFTPDYDCVRVSEDDLAMELVGQGVKLIGEDERVSGDGIRVKSTNVDRASQAFCTAFTKKYAELAERTPVYAQLHNLIDVSIAAAFIQQQDYYSKAGWNMELFNDETRFPVETYETPKQVETAVNAVWKGNTLMTPVGGGVAINATKALMSEHLQSDDNGQLKDLRSQINVKSLAKDQWWWD